MPAYQYLAINPQGEKKKGIISADNIYIAKKKLKEKKLSPIKLDLNSDKFNLFSSSKKKVSLVNLMLFTRQLSTLLSGGVPLNKSLSIINEQSNNIILKEQISEVLLNKMYFHAYIAYKVIIYTHNKKINKNQKLY